ncbi:uncharacterized protein LOC123450464 [Hordeum vulgare subsp. vulgare]|uniref:uncharacterized protein LOC123450464 n=1 Tax=Hordeum vulgare subsp. vulgare TaxID=112509 RepID=UPI001D1A3D09|nr:uncharacterized protein LOC123450464 [Hordeum vulgare subsp. vulgare]
MAIEGERGRGTSPPTVKIGEAPQKEIQAGRFREICPIHQQPPPRVPSFLGDLSHPPTSLICQPSQTSAPSHTSPRSPRPRPARVVNIWPPRRAYFPWTCPTPAEAVARIASDPQAGAGSSPPPRPQTNRVIARAAPGHPRVASSQQQELGVAAMETRAPVSVCCLCQTSSMPVVALLLARFSVAPVRPALEAATSSALPLCRKPAGEELLNRANQRARTPFLRAPRLPDQQMSTVPFLFPSLVLPSLLPISLSLSLFLWCTRGNSRIG